MPGVNGEFCHSWVHRGRAFLCLLVLYAGGWPVVAMCTYRKQLLGRGGLWKEVLDGARGEWQDKIDFGVGACIWSA